jgi:hypothetical protein
MKRQTPQPGGRGVDGGDHRLVFCDALFHFSSLLSAIIEPNEAKVKPKMRWSTNQ